MAKNRGFRIRLLQSKSCLNCSLAVTKIFHHFRPEFSSLKKVMTVPAFHNENLAHEKLAAVVVDILMYAQTLPNV